MARRKDNGMLQVNEVLERNSPAPVTLENFFPKDYFNEDLVEIVYMFSANEEIKADQSQISITQVSVFDRIEA